MLERAINQSFKIKAEIRFFIEKGNISLASPEDIIMNRNKIQPVFDLSTGRGLGSAAKTQ
jgi:hypothetical protein